MSCIGRRISSRASSRRGRVVRSSASTCTITQCSSGSSTSPCLEPGGGSIAPELVRSDRCSGVVEVGNTACVLHSLIGNSNELPTNGSSRQRSDGPHHSRVHHVRQREV